MKKIFKIVPFLAVAILVGVTAVYAGSLIPPAGDKENTMHSLEDIFNLAGGTPSTIDPALETPTGTPTGAGVTLNDVYDAVAGALPPTLTWQPVVTDPDTEAVIPLNLCWSYNTYEIDNGCTVGSGFIQTPDTLTTLGAVEYCKYLKSDGIILGNTTQVPQIWHLPTISEYNSITDYTKFGASGATAVTGFAGGSLYWSSTENAGRAGDAWYWSAWNGSTDSNDEAAQGSVRCVR